MAQAAIHFSPPKKHPSISFLSTLEPAFSIFHGVRHFGVLTEERTSLKSLYNGLKLRTAKKMLQMNLEWHYLENSEFDFKAAGKEDQPVYINLCPTLHANKLLFILS